MPSQPPQNVSVEAGSSTVSRVYNLFLIFGLSEISCFCPNFNLACAMKLCSRLHLMYLTLTLWKSSIYTITLFYVFMYHCMYNALYSYRHSQGGYSDKTMQRKAAIHIHTRTRMRTHTSGHTHTYTQPYTHRSTHTHTHTQPYAHMHAHLYAAIHAHTITHVCTQF